VLTFKAEAGRARKSERLKTEAKNTKITASKFGRTEPFYDSMCEITRWCTILEWHSDLMSENGIVTNGIVIP